MPGLRASILLALSLIAVAACSSNNSKGPPLQYCTPGQNGCPTENSALSKGKSPSDPNTPSDPAPTPGAPAPKPEPTPKTKPPPESHGDAGGGSSGGAVDACGQLGACCAAIRAAGITGTADNCDTVVAGGDPQGCDTELVLDSIPDDFYDPPAACAAPQ